MHKNYTKNIKKEQYLTNFQVTFQYPNDKNVINKKIKKVWQWVLKASQKYFLLLLNLSGTVLCDAPDGAKISSQHLFSPNYIVILSLIFLLVLFSSHPT